MGVTLMFEFTLAPSFLTTIPIGLAPGVSGYSVFRGSAGAGRLAACTDYENAPGLPTFKMISIKPLKITRMEGVFPFHPGAGFPLEIRSRRLAVSGDGSA
jgi:hypothetical protein